MPYRIAFVSLGCAKNLVNTEQMMALCRQASPRGPTWRC